jgi:hypothetical protein
MSKNTIGVGVVSWEIFDSLFENQADFCRKIRFLVKAGRATKEEGHALDIIFDQLNSKEKEIITLREKALNQRKELDECNDQDKSGRISTIYADLPETMSVLEKLESIRQQAGYPWENIKSIIEGTYTSMRKGTEEQ